jgi:IS5 family transposase
MLRIHFLQQWFNLSDPAMEEALYDTPLFREFAGIDIGEDVVPDESTILRFRHLLEAHGLAQRILETVNALLSQRGLLLKSGTVVGTSANVNDVTQAHALLHGQETDVFADAGYRSVDKREEVQRQHPSVRWHVAMMPGKRRALPKDSPLGAILEQLEQVKARIRAKGEHAFRVIKRQFGYVRVKYRGLAKNTANLMTLFARAMWMVRRPLLDMDTRG